MLISHRSWSLVKFAVGASALLLSPSCLDSGSFDAGNGSDSGAGAGGGPGQGGKGGGAGGATQCGPVCAIFCEFGNVEDERGCPTCACKKDPKACDVKECGGAAVPAIACADGSTPPLTCERNSATGQCSWRIGQCPVACPPLCDIACPFGNVIDANGCELCKCNPAPTCSQFRDLKACETNTACQWLEPGCSGVKLSVAGCFAKTDVNCKEGGCAGGRTCQSRTVDHCAGRPDLACITCASPINICL